MISSLGKPIDRVDGRAKVTGQARFAAEYPVAGMAHAYLVTATISKGRVKAIDTAAAKNAPGVLAVLTHQNAPKLTAAPMFNSGGEPAAAAIKTPPLQSDRVAWYGEPVAVVVANTFEQAAYAAGLVAVTYEAKPPALTVAGERDKAAPPPTILGEPPEVKVGDAEAALAGAAVKIDRAYTTPRENHNAIEPHATTAAWDGDMLTVYDASQYVAGVQFTLAREFGVPPENVRVLAPFVGGGFGGKGTAWPHVTLAVMAAKAVGRPVKLPLTREHVYHVTGGRSATEQRLALGADKDGKLVSIIQTGVSATNPEGKMVEPFTFPARHLYASPNIHLAQKSVDLDIAPTTFMRAPGEGPGTFVLESALDELSYELGLDPIELRRVNEPAKNPTPMGKKGEFPPFSSRHLLEATKLGAEKFGWAKRNPKPRSMRDGKFLVGMGMATAYYPAYQMPSSAKVRVNADGTAVALCSAQEMGMGTATAQAQNLAAALGIPVEKARLEYGDTKLPRGGVAGGSSQTISVGAAILASLEALLPKLIALAGKTSPLVGATAEAVEFRDGAVVLKADPKKGETIQAILGRTKVPSAEAGADVTPGDYLKKFSCGSYGAQFCEVKVDPDLGTVRVTRFVGAFDCGRILNAKTARSQFVGGIIMGIGMALMEHTHADERSGRIVNANLGEYYVPTNADVPAIEAFWVDHPDPQTPMGARGIGEIGITGSAAAVANAVFHATGVRIRDLPITPDKLLG